MSILIKKIKRLIYGAFFEKKWNIVISKNASVLPNATYPQKLSLDNGFIPKINKKYTFYADPFFSTDGSKIYAEALNPLNGLGEIVSLDKHTGKIIEVLLKGSHYSYPQSIQYAGEAYLLPEISHSSSPHFVKITENKPMAYFPITGLETDYLTDATYFNADQHHYIFGSRSSAANDTLSLFVSESFFGPYIEHPMSPIVCDPTCARMAGNIIAQNGKLFRLGQNNSRRYGEKIWICKINTLSPTDYSEIKQSEISFTEKVWALTPLIFMATG